MQNEKSEDAIKQHSEKDFKNEQGDNANKTEQDNNSTESLETNKDNKENSECYKAADVSNQEVKDKYKSQMNSGHEVRQTEEMNKLIVNLKDQLLRTIAELQNVKKRNEIEKANISNFSITAFAKDVLSIRDNLCLALANCKDHSDAIVEGVKMTLKHLDKILESYNIKIIASLNKQFDPNYHQAMSEAVSDKEPGTIIQVMQEGFMIKNRLLRPALVVVSKSK